MVLGREGQDWDRSDRRGGIVLPTLGLSIPLYPGHIFIFCASLIPHQVKLLPEAEQRQRTVVILLTCTTTKSYLVGRHGVRGLDPHQLTREGRQCFQWVSDQVTLKAVRLVEAEGKVR
jgi:hypothetical protein